MRRSFHVVLAALAAFGACAAASATPATDAVPADTAALTRFQRDLVSVLALRADARPLLGAALLARALPKQSEALDFHHLIERAAASNDAGPDVQWARLSDCDARADACPNADALSALEKLAPDNAAVWMLAIGQAARNDDRTAAREALARAAAASRYDDYTGRSLQALAYAVAALPPPADVLARKGPLASKPAGVQAMIVFGLGSAQPLPALQATAAMCTPKAVDDRPDRRAQCLALGKTLEWGGSALARSLGLHLRETLADGDDAREEARTARRDLIWQVQNYGRLTARAQTDPALADRLLALARNGGTEMSLMLASLRAAGLPVHAPADWQPGDARPAVSGSAAH